MLAVGSMIFLVVFLAVPALQRNQRNDARKRDQAQVVESIVSYTSNNPTKTIADDLSVTDMDNVAGAPTVYDLTASDNNKGRRGFGRYIDTLSNNTEKVKVLKTNNYSDIPQTIRTKEQAAAGSSKGNDSNRRTTIYVVQGAVCGDDHKTVEEGSSRQAAVIIWNETAMQKAKSGSSSGKLDENNDVLDILCSTAN